MQQPGAPAPKPTARNLLLITIDTLRADHVGAYGWARARTATLDGLARNGALFEHAYAAAPITLPSHATLLTGRYPPGHGARDNGLRVSQTCRRWPPSCTPGASRPRRSSPPFRSITSSDLNRGFDVYGDRLPRGADGRPANERPAADVVNDAIAWLHDEPGPRLRPQCRQPSAKSAILPLGPPLRTPRAVWRSVLTSRPALERYDEEIATADREAGRLIAALGTGARRTR